MKQYKVLLTLLLAFQAVAFISCSAIGKLIDLEVDEELLAQLEEAAENFCGPPDVADSCIYSNTGSIAEASQCTALCEERVTAYSFIFGRILNGPCDGHYRKVLGRCLPGSNLPPYSLLELGCTGVCMIDNGDISLGGIMIFILRLIIGPIIPPWLPIPKPPIYPEPELMGSDSQGIVVTAQMLNTVNEFIQRSEHEDFDYNNVLESSMCAGQFQKLEGRCQPMGEGSAFNVQQLVCTAFCQVENGEESLSNFLSRLLGSTTKRH